MIDRFGHGGHTSNRRFNVVGTMGRVICLRSLGMEILISTYCEPQQGALYSRMPLFAWPNEAANESHYFGPTP